MNLFSKSNLTLLNKIMVAFVAYVMAVLVVFSVIVILIDRGEVKSIADDYSVAISSNKSLVVSQWLDERVDDVRVLALVDSVKSFDNTAYLSFLQSARENQSDMYSRFFVIDADGLMKDTVGISEDWSEDEGYKKAMLGVGEVVITKPNADNTYNEPTFMILVPIVVEGRPKGVIGSTVILESLAEYISSDNISEKGHSWIVDGDGVVISHYNSKEILNLSIDESEALGFKGLLELKDGILSGEQGESSFENPDGEREYITYAGIESSPGWSVIVSLYASSIYGTVGSLMISMLIIFIVLVAMSILVSYFLAKDITNPIETLIDVTKKFTTGVKGIRARIESKDEIGELASSFNAMADTIVAHTDNLEELIMERTHTLADLNYQIVSRNKELGTMNEELEKTNNKLHELASTDMLTGLYNRHQFQRDLQKTIELVNVGDEQNFSLLFIDLDNFKYYNDTFSHEVGDFLLQEVAKILQSNVRDNDIVGRYGGDEFVIMLRQGDYEVAKAIAERMHAAILGRDGFKKDLAKRLNGEVKIMGKNKLSSSIGIINYMKSMGVSDAEELLGMADETMYKAKKAGKSRIVVG